MESIINKINDTKEVKKLSKQEKEQLAKECREIILQTVSENGGHLASNLGVVELTIALHSVFDVPKDWIIWDVGHQTYTHKLLTGRKEQFATLRKKGGIAGFPKVKESSYDCFNTGHSSTSISVALGIARARDIKKEKHEVVALIGDGALTGGMALEALNDAGSSKTKIIVILNDNEMSISKNVGGMSRLLGKLRTKKFYTNSNRRIKKRVEKIPYLGKQISKGLRRIKDSIKHLLISNSFFEDIGFKYFGPIDGHDIETLENFLTMVKEVEGPVLLHVVTKKGKGYLPAEENPDQYHGVGSFDKETGKPKETKKKDYSAVFGEKLIQLAKKNEKIVTITAAMKDGTGLSQFAKEFPERFFDVGIAEQHAVTLAAGLARAGMKPVVPIYSSFYQRAYDQIIHDVCMQSLPVVLCADRAGIVGRDGETHQGILDLAFCNHVPNLTILAPKDFEEWEQMLEFSMEQKNIPIFLRYPRGGEEKVEFLVHDKIELGKAEIVTKGRDITILAIGKMVARAYKIAKKVEEQNISCEVINVRFLKPFDENTIQQSIEKTKTVITIEDHIKEGGLASKVQKLIVDKEIQGVCMEAIGYPDSFISQASVEEMGKEKEKRENAKIRMDETISEGGRQVITC